LINPAPKAHIITALLHPEDYLVQDFGPGGENDHTAGQNSLQADLSMLPDTSILFRRYLEAGRMINVYDWFESFAVVLESQRRDDKDDTDDGLDTNETLTKKGKGKEQKLEYDEETEVEDEEKWKMEVQARFIRAIHELDFIGLVKPTGRKADHVLKTVFDVPDQI
jgi:origin recognition complex subunit 3